MKRKLDNKGFAMVELLVVSVSVVATVGLLYNLVYPIISEYKAIEHYEDVDAKYAAFYIKSMIESDIYVMPSSYGVNTIHKTHAYMCKLDTNYVTEDGGDDQADVCVVGADGELEYKEEPIPDDIQQMVTMLKDISPENRKMISMNIENYLKVERQNKKKK